MVAPSLRQTIDGFLKMAQRTPNFWYRTIACALIHGHPDSPLTVPRPAGCRRDLRNHVPGLEERAAPHARGGREVAARHLLARRRLLAAHVLGFLRRARVARVRRRRARAPRRDVPVLADHRGRWHDEAARLAPVVRPLLAGPPGRPAAEGRHGPPPRAARHAPRGDRGGRRGHAPHRRGRGGPAHVRRHARLRLAPLGRGRLRRADPLRALARRERRRACPRALLPAHAC
jgi:hypothetical protein